MNDWTVAPGFAGVARAFEQNLADGLEGGASLAIYRGDELVVDLWGGTDPVSNRPWERDSATVIFSCTKPAAAVVLLRLVGRGEVLLDDPLARYWPEFGEESITVRMMLTHLSALPAIHYADVSEVLDDRGVAARLARSTPAYPPGSAWIYHPLSFGYLVGELVRRVTGRSIGTVFRQEIAEPLDLDFWIGLPASERDRFRPGHYDEMPDSRPLLSTTSDLHPPLAEAVLAAVETEAVARREPGQRPGDELMNTSAYAQAEIAGAGGVATARSLAKFYAALLGPVDGIRLLSTSTLAEAVRNQTAGIAPVTGPPGLGQVEPKSFGLGFDHPTPYNPMLGPGSFGHGGMGGRLGFAHPDSGISLGYVSTRMIWTTEADPRWVPILAALNDAVA